MVLTMARRRRYEQVAIAAALCVLLLLNPVQCFLRPSLSATTAGLLHPIRRLPSNTSSTSSSSRSETIIQGWQSSFLVTKRRRRRTSAGRLESTALSVLGSPSVAATVAVSPLLYDLVTSTSDFLVRIVFLRAMAFVHAVAFLVAFHQNKPLIGDKGITPARIVLQDAQERGRIKAQRRLEWRKSQQEDGMGDPVLLEESAASPSNAIQRVLYNIVSIQRQVTWRASKIRRRIGEIVDGNSVLLKIREVLWDRCDPSGRPLPTLLWLAKDRNHLNSWLDRIALSGLAVSAYIFVSGAANVPLVLALWLLQRSLMAVGGPWYGYGWEPQLAELSFHALFLVPLLSLQQLPNFPMPPPVKWAIRWYLFRIMIGSGLVKLRSRDVKWNWKYLTAMDYFYETQPVPNPLTRYFHWMSPDWHKVEVLINHFVELIAPWLLIVPGLPVTWRRAGGLIQLGFQSVLILSGNLSFLNWLTMVPAIVCLDDAFLAPLFSSAMQTSAMSAAWTCSSSITVRTIVSWTFLSAVLWLSIPVVRNLFSKKQLMNASFDKLRLVNTYGAFGNVNEERLEWIVSSGPTLDGPWREYEFRIKPGGVYRRPRFLSPYHYRLDWQMWIAATCRTVESSGSWIYMFLLKLLQRDAGVLGLLEKNEGGGDPWADMPLLRPKFIRIDCYRYKFHEGATKQSENDGDHAPPYWDRQYVGRVFPKQGVADANRLRDEIKYIEPRRMD